MRTLPETRLSGGLYAVKSTDVSLLRILLSNPGAQHRVSTHPAQPEDIAIWLKPLRRRDMSALRSEYRRK
jgi:hypothetical protein